MNCSRCNTDMIKKGIRNGKQRYFCKSCGRWDTYTEHATNGNVLCVPDLHHPYVHPKALRFVSDLKKEYNCDTVVFLGDLFDFSGFSTHTKDPNSLSSIEEIYQADTTIREWIDEFPIAKVCWGNHELRLQKRLKEAGIPKQFLPSLNTVFGLPDTWIWDFHFVIDGVRYMHSNASGVYLHARLMKDYMQNVVHGHTHSTGAVQFMSTDNDLIWGMNTGCLIDTKSYAFEYARDFSRRPVLGAGVVLNHGKLPLFIPMEL